MAEPEKPEAAEPDPEAPRTEPVTEPGPTGTTPATEPAAEPATDSAAARTEPAAEPAGKPASEPSPAPGTGPDAGPDTEAKTEVSPPATRRGNIRMIVAIGLAVVVLSGGGVAIAIVASRPRPEDIALQQEKTKAREVAQKFAGLLEQARNDGAFSLAKPDVQAVLCTAEQDALDQEWQDRENKELARSYVPSPAARLAITVKDVQIEGDHGKVTMTGTQADSRRDQDYALVKEESQWKICGVTFRTPSSSARTTSSEPTESDVPSDGVEPSDIYGPGGTSGPATTGSATTVTTTESEPLY